MLLQQLFEFSPHQFAPPPLPSFFCQLIEPILLIGLELSFVGSGFI
jgi:hypothetical protein